MQDFYPTLPKADNTKAMIINCLANDWPLTTKQIHNKIVKESAANISYQAIHKTINELLDSKILEKTENNYQLSKSWIEQNIKFFSRLTDSYSKGEKQSLEELWKKDYASVTFETLIELGKFLIHTLFRYPNPESKPYVSIEKQAYPMIGLSQEDIKGIEDTVLKLPCYVIEATNTPSDRYFANIKNEWSKNMHTKYGIRISDNCDVMIVGDYVAEIFINDKLLGHWHKLYAETKNFDEFNLKKFTDLIYHESGKITVTVQKNSIIADEIRKKVIAYFDE